MILHPGIVALLVGSVATTFLTLYAGWYGLVILRKWDLRSGSELQLSLERRTYLISTILGYGLLFQVFSLFLFIYTVDSLQGLFTGAMCAAGVLNVGGNGYLVLELKIATFLAAGTWLVVNHADSRGYDYPLVKPKYFLLLLLVPVLLLETALTFRYFAALHPDIITSCCGSLFSQEQAGVAGDLAALPAPLMMKVLTACLVATAGAGLLFLKTGKWGAVFAVASFLTLLAGAASLVSFICLYVYGLPSHHCPFCILKREYNFIGYLLYGALFGGGLGGLGVGALAPLRSRGSMPRVIPPLQRRLVAVTLAMYLLFAVTVVAVVVASPLKLLGNS